MKSLRTSIVVLSVLVSQWFSAGAARGEPGGLHLNLTPFGGYGQWAKDVNLDNGPHFGGRVGLGFGRHLGIEGYYSWMKSHTEYGGVDSLWTSTSLTPETEVSINGYGADLILNLFPSIAFNPYVLGGWHEEKIKSDVSDAKVFMNNFEFGGGVKLGFGRKTALRLEIRDKIWRFDSPPAPDPPGDKSVHNLFYTAGIQITLGGSGGHGDADKDGVKDNLDTCPDTPRGALVDASGCPLDADADRVPDGLDQCPDTPAGATVDARGCPSDSDNDGVPDGVDQCANTPPGTQVDARGCLADSDGDGVADAADRCAGTPPGTRVDEAGCPLDADKDGVPDGVDQCPDTPAGTQVDTRGCPVDSDQDGVLDDKDICPNTQADVKVDSDGCPIELTERDRELLDKGTITTREIHFETAKWDILPESQPVLDGIGTTLIQWPRLRIEVGGHCDWRGSDAYNLDLSQKRSQAVLDYLLGKFPQIARDQYEAKGYGESKPVATNKTVEGMARNRRVEFKVLNTEELTKERERRRLLKKGE